MAKVATYRIVLVALLAIVVGSGCAKRTRITDAELAESDLSGSAGTGYDYADQDGREGSSLGRYQQGLAPSEDGVLKDVHFGYDSFELDPVARDVLAANAAWLRENPRTRTEVEGHCDERGTIEYNLALGARRAKAVKDYLVSLGIAAHRLSTISYGEELPVCREPTDSCFSRNRRAHFLPPAE